MTEINEGTLQWLLDGPAYVRYRTLLDLCQVPYGDERVVQARREMLSDPAIRSLMTTVADPWRPLNSHKSASHPIHYLEFLAEIGVRVDDEPLPAAVGRLKADLSEDGQYRVPMVISKHFGGSGVENLAWVLCDAPIIVFSLARMGLADDKNVVRAAEHVASLVSENGWRCTGSKEIGKFRGPGKKTDPCPYATLISLKAMAEFPALRKGEASDRGVECLLHLWDMSEKEHPYMFYMGTDFRKVKAPFVWYDIMHMAEVLSRFPQACDDDRFKEMLFTLFSKVDDAGRLTTESVWQDFAGWDFGKCGVQSRWSTLAWHRIHSRLE